MDEGLAIAQTFVHENRLRQAASSCGAARFCLDRSIERAKSRRIWGGKSLSENQAIQFPVVELATQVEMLTLLILKTGVDMDRVAGEAEREGKKPWVEIEKQLSHTVAMCNFWANILVCQAADRAIQVFSGLSGSVYWGSWREAVLTRADPRGRWLLAPLPIRTHLSPFPTVSHYGGVGGNSDEEDCGVFVRI